ncbi:MAG TPA: hypothetical protein VHB46_15895 [Burkholderiales bacterium]|nr:hypothetical protein [Burkholderiales bacterium]
MTNVIDGKGPVVKSKVAVPVIIALQAVVAAWIVGGWEAGAETPNQCLRSVPDGRRLRRRLSL